MTQPVVDELRAQEASGAAEAMEILEMEPSTVGIRIAASAH